MPNFWETDTTGLSPDIVQRAIASLNAASQGQTPTAPAQVRQRPPATGPWDKYANVPPPPPGYELISADDAPASGPWTKYASTDIPPPPAGFKRIEFEGAVHEFPDDFTDQDIAGALGSGAKPPSKRVNFEGQSYNFPDGTSDAEIFSFLDGQGRAAPVAAAAAEPVPETPSADAPPQTWAQYAEGLAQKVAQGTTFNFGDEIAAGAGSLGNTIARCVGMNIPEKSYRQILDEIHGREKEFETANPGTALAAEIGGGLATGLGTGVTAARLLARAPGLARRGLVRSAAGAGLTAAPMGGLNAVGELEDGDKTLGDYGQTALEGGAMAGAFGMGLGTAGHGIGRVVGPWASEAAQRLHDRGIRLTPGELLGPNAKRAEDAITTVPFVNKLLRDRLQEGVEDFNRVTIDDVLRDLNQGVNGVRLQSPTALPANVPVGHEGGRFMEDTLRDAFDAVTPRLRGEINQQLENQVQAVRATLPDAMRGQFDDAMQRHIVQSADANGRIIGVGVQNALSGLRDEARGLTTPAPRRITIAC